MTENTNPPVAKLRVGRIHAAIWKRKTETGSFFTATFERRYRDGEGQWKSTGSYDADDLLALSKAADLAHTRILELDAE